MATRLSGKPVAEAINAGMMADIQALKARGIAPTLAIVRVGERGEDVSYERGAMKRCEMVGVGVECFALNAGASQQQLLDVLENINRNDKIHGVLLFRPLPKHMDEHMVCQAIASEKDVDGVTDQSLAGVFAGREQGFPPGTPAACLAILDHYGIEPSGKRVAVVGRSLVVGRPVSMMLVSRSATVTICHTKTPDLPAVCRRADILIVAAGRPNVVDHRYLSPGQVVIDVGVNVLESGALSGDVDYERADSIVEAITPVPGGVGMVTTSVLVQHVVEAAKRAYP